ncbi:MAG: Fic family protein [Bdellovibrio sp.]|nr:Fic family protein [Bdellovibrio sp.]
MELYKKQILISPKILKLIAEIDEFKGSWSSLSQHAPDRLTSLKKIATIESIASSTRIEGVKLSDSEVKALLSGLDINSFKSRDEEEVAGYAEVMNLIFESHRVMSLSENTIKQLHQVLLKFSSKDVRHRGDYKKLNNHVEAFEPDGKSLGVVFQTATPFETPLKMEKLCHWLNKTLLEKDEHPLLVIAKFILDFLAIHPFQDGNGRLSRALTTLLLLKANYDYVPYSSMERVIEENKDKYYLCLRGAQTEPHDSSDQLVKWIEFFLDCLVTQKNVLSRKLENEKTLLTLPKLSEQIIIALKEHGKLSLSEVVKLTLANRNTVKAHLSKLVLGKKIQKEGIGKGTVYYI